VCSFRFCYLFFALPGGHELDGRGCFSAGRMALGGCLALGGGVGIFFTNGRESASSMVLFFLLSEYVDPFLSLSK
jgi:hypothetical protein